jgi:hypothetical protein
MELDEEKLKLRLREILLHLAAQVPASRSDFWTLVGEVVQELDDETQLECTSKTRLTLVK